MSEITQPHCPDCSVVMRDHPKGYLCPSCGRLDDHSAEMAAITIPPEFDGPDIYHRP